MCMRALESVHPDFRCSNDLPDNVFVMNSKIELAATTVHVIDERFSVIFET